MLSIKPSDDPPDLAAPGDEAVLTGEGESVAPAVPAPLWRRLFSKPVVGLDIGTSMMKAVVLERRRDGLALKRIAYAETPPGALTNGVLTDSVAVSEHLRALFKDYRIRTRRIAVAAGGEKVLCQTERLRWASPEERLALIEQSVASTVTYPIEGAAVAFEELEKPGEKEGVLFWASAPLDRVDWLRETVSLAGCQPAIVDMEACALANAVVYNYQPEPDTASVLVHFGARKFVIGLLIGDRLDYARSAQVPGQRPGERRVCFSDRVLSLVDGFWDALGQRAKPLPLGRLFVSGGPVEVSAIGEALHSKTGLLVTRVDPFRRISCPPEVDSGQLTADGSSTFSVAVGLALRGFEEL
ncbi:MAG: pilus assembly protein PilM [Acidobacteria bacterium]|nr:pilus assembly protein PilM [Acidobacteriota bacterium]